MADNHEKKELRGLVFNLPLSPCPDEQQEEIQQPKPLNNKVDFYKLSKTNGTIKFIR